MKLLTRRKFCAVSAAATACAAASSLAALDSMATPFSTGYALVASVEHDRIVRLANRWLTAKPFTVTRFRSPRSPGGVHDFFSEADYFWPNPANPAGPYKEIDGRSNPDNFQEHRKAMIRLSQAVPALTAGFLLTRKSEFAKAAQAHVIAWFVTPAARMNPSLEYSQGVRNGGPTGRSYGIIDTLHLVEVARAASFLKATMKPADYAGVQGWFREYLGWMKTSEKGQKERDSTNNHAIAWALQAAEFARLTGDEQTRKEVRTRFETVQLPMQEAPDGSFPRELHRTKPYGYSIFQFDVATAVGWSLGILGRRLGRTKLQVSPLRLRYAKPRVEMTKGLEQNRSVERAAVERRVMRGRRRPCAGRRRSYLRIWRIRASGRTRTMYSTGRLGRCDRRGCCSAVWRVRVRSTSRCGAGWTRTRRTRRLSGITRCGSRCCGLRRGRVRYWPWGEDVSAPGPYMARMTSS